MNWISFWKNLYTLETLDTRFVTPSSVPYRPGLTPTRARFEATGIKPDSIKLPARRWNKPEFLFYYFALILAVPLMIKQVVDVSSPSHENYHLISPFLSPGWIGSRQMDNSDGQFSSFRDNFPGLCGIMVVHISLRKIFEWYSTRSDLRYPAKIPSLNGNSILSRASARLRIRTTFDCVIGLGFLFILHGFSFFKILAILYANYQIAHRSPRRWIPLATWIFNLIVLFSNEIHHGYPLIETFIRPGSIFRVIYESHLGLIPRWGVLFKISLLRMISFNMDYYWSIDTNEKISTDVNEHETISERDRIKLSASADEYSFKNYLAYTLYCPLFLAGPITTFNDYLSQQKCQPHSISKQRNLAYAVRFLIALLSMELFIHFIYPVAIFKAQPPWGDYTPFQLSMLGFFNLIHIWLKLLLPWRFFRLWALLDRFDAPENMVRCVSNNYSTLAFWRGWHRSFNRWVVRYVYVPLGGSAIGGTRGKLRAALNFLLVFTFVALWHDVRLRLLQWSWLISLFVLPEILAKTLFPAKLNQNHPEISRILCGLGAVFNIILMIAANLVGFAIGLDGVTNLLRGVFQTFSSSLFVTKVVIGLLIGAFVMFEQRAEESRRGIIMKC